MTPRPCSTSWKATMLLFDVNVLVYAHREDTQRHKVCAALLEHTANGVYPFGFSDLIASGFLRVVTHPKVFDPLTPIKTAMTFLEDLRDRPNAILVTPGTRHWGLFSELCRKASVRGNLVPDAYLAALAMESGCTFVTTDRDYSRFPGLDWMFPE